LTKINLHFHHNGTFVMQYLHQRVFVQHRFVFQDSVYIFVQIS
jgi:hypothetical protein